MFVDMGEDVKRVIALRKVLLEVKRNARQAYEFGDANSYTSQAFNEACMALDRFDEMSDLLRQRLSY
jgi:hypothetical protein